MKLLSTLLALCFITFSAFAKPIMVFDAGSSGTRVYLYDVSTDANGKVSVTTLKYYKPSSSTTTYTYPVTDARFAADPVGYFEHFLTEIETVAFDRASTPIYVYATAGVRMSENPAPQVIIDDMRTGIRAAAGTDYPNITDEQVDTLSVAEEALNVWINDQYVTEQLNAATLDRSAMYTAIEMGGASSEVSGLSRLSSEFDMPFLYRGESYDVYSMGYDGSGQDKARDAMMKAYQANPDDKQKFAGCFPVGAPYPLSNPELVGTGNFADCQAFIEAHPVNSYDSGTPLANKYLLTSGFYYTFKALGIADETVLKETSRVELQKTGAAFCGKTWDALQAEFPGDAYLINYCFNSAFQDYFLNEVDVPARATLLSIDKYNGKPMTWTLGVAYQHAE